jgi:hypothetical protein
MADIADQSDEAIEERTSDRIAESHRVVAAIEQGEPGECEGCAEYSLRLVGGKCAHCRDRDERMKRITGKGA